MTTKEIGDIGENAAAKFLKKNGYKVQKRNIHLSHNEIDIIAEDHDFIVFAEVKTRTGDPYKFSRYGVPSSAVNYKKQENLLKAARAFLKSNPTTKQPRMDVIEVWLDEAQNVVAINHIRNAYCAR